MLLLLRQVVDVIRGVHRPSVQQREDLLNRLERTTELPLLLLAFLMIPLIAGPFLWNISAAEIALLSVLNVVIWIAFGADLAVKLAISPNRIRYLRRHWLDVLIVAIPFFRPLRIVQLLIYGSRALSGSRTLSRSDFLIAYAFGALVTATTVIVAFERNADSQLAEFPDALWWGVVTITTVGYGDITPVTAGGRIVAALLMVVGIGLFSFVTANVASKLARQDEKIEQEKEGNEMDELTDEVKQLRAEIARLSELVEARSEAD